MQRLSTGFPTRTGRKPCPTRIDGARHPLPGWDLLGRTRSVVGREQAGQRPFLVLSVEQFNHTDWQIVIGVPLTTTDWANPAHIRIEPVESGLPRISYAMPEMVRSLSIKRLERQLGRAPVEAVDLAAKRIAVFTGLGRTRH